MEERYRQALLYDFYGDLLTAHQQQIYEDFALNDLSLSEIAEEQNISRQGVHDLVKRCNKLLSGYEEKLHLVEKFLMIQKKAESICGISEYLLGEENPSSGDLRQKISDIRQISQEIIKEL